MKYLLLVIALATTVSILNGQPCKVVKPGMTKTEVLKLVGKPTEIDTAFSPSGSDSGQIVMTIWQYGDVMYYGNQRVHFIDDFVYGDVITDGRKYDELIKSFEHGDFPEKELTERINKLNRESCQ